jgi:hypothetical protein
MEAAAWGEDSLAGIRARFRGTDTPIVMEYQLGYRFLNFELSRLGWIRLTTTGGMWRHRVSDKEVPVVFIDVHVDSCDRNPQREKNRISLHDEMIGVLTLPDLHALIFSKHTDEYLNPVFGRRTVSQAVSVYDTQAGKMDYVHRDLTGGGMVNTNLTRPEELLELSRQIRPIMDYLIGQCRTNQAGTTKGRDRISVNLDGQVVTLRLVTQKERSPGCLDGRRMDSLRIETVQEGRRQSRARAFFAWAMPFGVLAEVMDDDGLRDAACAAMVESVVPLVVDYELAVGRIRASLVAVAMEGSTNATGTACAELSSCQRARKVQ